MATKLPSIMPARNLTVVSTLELNNYTLTFKINDTIVKTGEVTYTFPIEYPSDSEINAKVPTGYAFKGWNSTPTTMPSTNLTLTAELEQVEYTITYFMHTQETGSMNYGEAEHFATQKYHYGDEITAPTAAEIVGYDDPVWADLPETMPAKDIEVHGYRDCAKFTITFKVDGTVVKQHTLAYGHSIPYPEDPVKDGYTFKGWDSNIQTVPAYDVTINAVFEVIPTYTIEYRTRKQYYNAETGTIAYTEPETIETQTYREGDTITPPEYPTEDGYTATGWVYEE